VCWTNFLVHLRVFVICASDQDLCPLPRNNVETLMTFRAKKVIEQALGWSPFVGTARASTSRNQFAILIIATLFARGSSRNRFRSHTNGSAWMEVSKDIGILWRCLNVWIRVRKSLFVKRHRRTNRCSVGHRTSVFRKRAGTSR